tara:strand:+ start:1146 stop:2069 length:924 start_codon:yes stop_codon:yes gene_type:complete
MRTSPHNRIQSEIDEIEKILAGLPEDAVIERYAFQKRLENAQQALKELPSEDLLPEAMKLTFRGTPIDESHGISADFAGKASNAFADAFAAVLAGKNNRLSYMGPIPDKSRFPLMIVGMAVGSFGFEIELPKSIDLIGDQAGAGVAVETLKNLLRVSAIGTDEEVADLVEEVHPRAVRKVSDFLEVLQQNDAWCGIEFRGDFFKYSDVEQLKVSEARLKEENISRTENSFFGEFQGVLPQGRSFEFKVSGERTVLRGKIDDDIEDPDVLNRDWLHQPVQATFSVVQVGQGRPRYTLLDLENISIRNP